LVRAWC